MNSVKQMVLNQRKQDTERADYYEAKVKREQKIKEKEIFNDEVEQVIVRFNQRFFSLNSTNHEVSQLILELDKWTHKRLLFESDEAFRSVVFSNKAYKGQNPITTSARYNKWKKALENRFGVLIWIREDYRSERRFGSSGFETYPNEIYLGIEVRINFP